MPGDALKDLAEYIGEQMEDYIDGVTFAHDELVVNAHREAVLKVLHFLRDDKECKCQVLVDVCGVDYPERKLRFDVVYNLLSLKQNHRIRVKVKTDEATPVPSVTSIFSAAGWFEREVWDMYGVMFDGHTDLRRILTDYGFEGHPQRKDFPLTGTVELRYDEELKRVVYEPVQLTQDFRVFDNVSPWEGMTDVQLPGDEKAAIPPHGWHKTRVKI